MIACKQVGSGKDRNVRTGDLNTQNSQLIR